LKSFVLAITSPIIDKNSIVVIKKDEIFLFIFIKTPFFLKNKCFIVAFLFFVFDKVRFVFKQIKYVMSLLNLKKFLIIYNFY
jgi:hypothetical protein